MTANLVGLCMRCRRRSVLAWVFIAGRVALLCARCIPSHRQESNINIEKLNQGMLLMFREWMEE